MSKDALINVIPLWYEPSTKYKNLVLNKDFIIVHYIDPITMRTHCDLVHRDAIPRMESAIKGAYTVSVYNYIVHSTKYQHKGCAQEANQAQLPAIGREARTFPAISYEHHMTITFRCGSV